MKEISKEVKAMIGKEKTSFYYVTDRDIRRFAQAIDDKNPLYHDQESAKETRYGGVIAPPLFCQMFAYDDVDVEDLKRDGSPKEIDVPLPTERVLGGGSSFEIGEPVRIGDTIEAKRMIKEVFQKKGRSGDLYFVVIENTWTNQDNKLVARELATYINR